MVDLFKEFEELEDSSAKSKDVIIKAPFGYPGGKSRSIINILPHLPYSDKYVSVFGGSGCDILARRPVKLEVFNDRYAGVTDFYRCLRDPRLFDRLCQWLELTLHSRQEFVECRASWENVEDPVERAGRWYYMTVYSFGSLGRNFGRALSVRGLIGNKIRKHLQRFDAIHQRFRNVQVESQDWSDCLVDYDSDTTVFYCDPPYIDASSGIYREMMSVNDHRHFLELIARCKGYVAVSGYHNPLYDNQPYWHNWFEWSSFVSIESMAFTEGNKKADLKDQAQRGHAREVLWIKDFGTWPQ